MDEEILYYYLMVIISVLLRINLEVFINHHGHDTSRST